MYSVVISTVGGLFIISFLEIKIEIDSRCQIKGHIVPHPFNVLSSILFQMGCHGNHKLAKYSHFFYNFLLDICHISVLFNRDIRLMCQIEGFTISHPLMILGEDFVFSRLPWLPGRSQK